MFEIIGFVVTVLVVGFFTISSVVNKVRELLVSIELGKQVKHDEYREKSLQEFEDRLIHLLKTSKVAVRIIRDISKDAK